MKMHRILAEAASNIAKSVFREHRVLDHELANPPGTHPHQIYKWLMRPHQPFVNATTEVTGI
jgi:hypothetical protein